MPYVLLILLILSVHNNSIAQSKQREAVLHVVERFFDALEKQDTAALNEMYVEGGRNYSVFEAGDSLRIRYQDPSQIRFSPHQIIRERMRKETTAVQINGNIAMAWVPYDLWVNETFSHCGVDVFTLVKTSGEWKIATISYTIEKTGCD